MWSITLKLMRKNARMLIPAGIAILIGTMFIASTLLFGNTLDYSLRRQISASYGGRELRGRGQRPTTRRCTASPSAT